MHVSTRTCYIHHKRGVTEVWHMALFWVSYGRCTMPGSQAGLLLPVKFYMAGTQASLTGSPVSQESEE